MTEKLVIDNDILFENVIRLMREGREVIIPVKGYSMNPLIRQDKDLVVLEGVESGTASSVGKIKRVWPYDIVLFRYNGKFILHRILSIDGDNVVIQGDGNIKGVEKCKLDNIYGRVTKILINGKRELDPYSKRSVLFFRIWKFLRPVRRYILGVYRRLWKA